MSSVLNKQNELKTLCKSLSSAQELDNKTELQRILNKLYAVGVDEKLLRATGAGQVVGKLRSNEDSEIAMLAKKVVYKWKKDVKSASSHTSSPVPTPKPASRPQTPQTLPDTPQSQQPRADNKSGSSNIRSSSNGSPAIGSSTGMLQGRGTASGSSTMPPTPSAGAHGTAARTAVLDGANIPKVGDMVRDKCTEVLYNSMAADSNADPDLIVKRAADIERIEFEKAGSTSSAYRARIRSLCHNLKDKKNPELCINVVEGSISAQRFCSMSSEEMASKELRSQIEKMKEDNLFKAKGADRAKAVTDQFKCGRCKNRKCTYFQMQTRSADEPMTTFVTCTVCDNHWKFC
ncbi:transcription elongation factor TFIIS [Coemansia brasiliensis]|uniref:Transcription elongation factor n=1 Tax=Coemansia brasiliensis TaxID=2650707 RepID=A0A9W8I7X8_9FUNG|nr:transcription elongation factor TFIIS [Coemansia brasiliensis]